MFQQTEIVFFFQTHYLNSGFAKMDVADRTQSFSRLFCRQVALGFRQHFVTDHKFAHGCRTQQRRIKVCVQLPVLVFSSPLNGAPCQPME